MKLALLSTTTLAATALAAPTASASSAPSAAPSASGLNLNQLANDDEVWGQIVCTAGTKICTAHCRLNGVDIACQLMAILDSVLYGIEQLGGFTVNCTTEGCQAICPVDGTLVCTANEVVATWNSAWALGESVILGGPTWILDSIGDIFS